MIVSVEILIIVYVLLIGLCVGSFIALATVRIPQGESVVRPRSHCRDCQAPVAWYDNIPLLSYLWLKGRCRHCQAKISLVYPAIEIISTLVILLAYWKIQPLLKFIAYLVAFVIPVLMMLFIDWKALILPNILTLPGIILGFLVHWLDGRFFQAIPTPHMTLWQESLLGSVIGFGLFYAVSILYEKLRGREGLGMGDAKLVAMFGAFFGVKGVLLIIFLASFFGSLLGLLLIALHKVQQDTPIPFGSLLCSAALAYLFFQREIFMFLEKVI